MAVLTSIQSGVPATSPGVVQPASVAVKRQGGLVRAAVGVAGAGVLVATVAAGVRGKGGRIASAVGGMISGGVAGPSLLGLAVNARITPDPGLGGLLIVPAGAVVGGVVGAVGKVNPLLSLGAAGVMAGAYFYSNRPAAVAARNARQNQQLVAAVSALATR